ncbi:S8 family serine peptidase [Bacillus thuringiensis]|uniref:S8 family serine peptidase n=1 Tax=Bacillus thuringiensis TaxID=1428 RepID=UPI003D00CA97
MIKQGELLVTFHSHVDRQAKNRIHTQISGRKIDKILQLHVEVLEVLIGEEKSVKKPMNNIQMFDLLNITLLENYDIKRVD